MAKQIIMIIVIVCILLVLAESKRYHRRCPSRDDEHHVCRYLEKKTYQATLQFCGKCQETAADYSQICHYLDFKTWWFEQGCRNYKTVDVTVLFCIEKCCDGWTRDEDGQCSIEDDDDDDDDDDDIVCENGGSSDNGHCSCPDGFVGKHCETPVCTPQCLNNGVCTGRDGKAVCVCSEGRFTGKQCETPVCDPGCQNGGSCVVGTYGSLCTCVPGFEGKFCEKRIKDGKCPVPTGAELCVNACRADSECQNKQKCCKNSCGSLQCMAPALTECTYKDKQYPIGFLRKNDSCTSCLCRDTPNQWDCVTMGCPALTCDKTKMTPNACCPVCDDTHPPSGNGPSFRHCPKEKLVIHTHEERFIDIRKSVNLTVVGSSGVYQVRYSKEIIKAVSCSCSKNIHIVTAQSKPDIYGRIASCHFSVHVLDNHPPIYSSCPADIAAFEDEIISWDKPKATDNIGIKSEKIISDYENNSKFPEGTHVVMYVSVDHEGNVGVCRFLVAIYKRGTSDPTMPSELKKENRDNSKMNITLSVVGLLAGVVLLIVVVLCALYCRRMKKRRNEQTTGSDSNAYNNEIYATTPTSGTPPPSYGKAGGMKLPPAYITGDDQPPVYEELDVKVFSKRGIHNPVYDTSVDLDVADIEVQVQKEKCHKD